MKSERTHVVFYFPWRELSGGPVYLAGLAKHLANREDFAVTYVDYEDGQAARSLAGNPKIEILFVTEDDFSVDFQSQVVLIAPIYWAHWIPRLPGDSRVLFVNWHKLAIPVLRESSGIRGGVLNKFLKAVSKHHGVFFCDKSHALGQDLKDQSLLDAIVPISVDEKKSYAPRHLVSPGEANIGVLGRLSPDKISSVINLLENFEILETTLAKRVHIIGDGPCKDLIVPSLYPTVKIIFLGELAYKKLHPYLKKNLDAVFGMGTSVLEAASLRLPSVIIPHSMDAISGDNFVFIHETSGACLGWYPGEYEKLDLKPKTLKSLFDEIFDRNGKSSLGDKALRYFEANHRLDLNGQKLVERIAKTTLEANSLENYFSKQRDGDEFGLRRIPKLPFLYFRFDSHSKAHFYLFRRNFLRLPIAALGAPGTIEKTILVFGVPLFRAKLTGRRLRIRLFTPDLMAIWRNNVQLISGQVSANLETHREFDSAMTQRIEKLELALEKRISESTQQSVRVIESRLNKLDEEIFNMNKMVGVVGNQINRSIAILESRDRPFDNSYLAMTIPTDILDDSSLLEFRGDIEERYVRLVKDLPDESVSEIVRILDRLRKTELAGSKYWFTQEEEVELRKIFDLHASRILRLSEQTWAYGKYLLPTNVISTTTFFSRYFVDELQNLDEIKESSIIDAGGFFGDSLLVFHELTNEGVHVFEPNADLFRMCRRTVELNQIKNAHLNQLALGAEVGKLHLLEEGDSSKIIDSNETQSYPEEKVKLIEVTTIDSYVQAHGLKVGLIKADVEGFEQQLLLGALETIKSQRPTLLMSMYHNVEQFFGLKTFLESLDLGYTFRVRKPHDTSVIIDTILIAEAKSNEPR